MQPASSSLSGDLVRYATLPNVISFTRLLTAPILIALAARSYERAFLVVAITLLMTDWVDGRIARARNQQTVFGARLDAFSDVTIYVCIAAGIWLLRPAAFWNERYWLLAIAVSYGLALATCLAKFGCLPNYHTRTSKASWLLVTIGVVAMLLNWSIWPLRLAFAAVIVANLESIAVTLVLRRWRPDVGSVVTAAQLRDHGLQDSN